MAKKLIALFNVREMAKTMTRKEIAKAVFESMKEKIEEEKRKKLETQDSKGNNTKEI